MAQSVTIETTRPTYAYRAADITPAATPTDVLALVGAAGKIIRITKIGVSGSATAAALLSVYITKRTALNTGGTSTNPVATKYDSLDATTAATVVLYSANPSALGAGTGLEGDKIYLPALVSPANSPTHWMVDYTGSEAKCPMLRNASESISINFAGATLATGTSLYLYFEWTEEFGA